MHLGAVSQNNILDMFSSPVLVSGIIAWFIAQSIKVVATAISVRRFDVAKFIASGGMPSSHTSSTIAIAVAIGIVEGFSSSLFALALGMSFVVMYDAAGVRRAAGKQAAVINEIIELIKLRKHIEPKLKELLGHTPFEVLMGALLGVIVATVVTALI